MEIVHIYFFYIHIASHDETIWFGNVFLGDSDDV